MSLPSPGDPDPVSVLQAFEERIQERFDKLERHLDRLSLNVIRQLEAFIQLQGCLGPILAPLHGWSISADLALLLVRLVQMEPPDLVVEFGSGVSTSVLLAALGLVGPAAEGAGAGSGHASQLIAFEHLPQCHAATEELIRASSHRHWAQVRLAPLEPWSDASGTFSFYGGLEAIGACLAPLRRLTRSVRLLVFVDGPPGNTNPRARYPALPLLLEQLERGSGRGPNLAVNLILDDFERREEQEVASAWEDLLRERGIRYRRSELITENGTLRLSWETRL